jgi:hypothetical protein
MNTQKAAKWFGIVFIAIGVLGFIPGVTNAEGNLLGLFRVDAIHNVIHLLSGIVALLCAGSVRAAKGYFKIFGVVYGLVTVLGFLNGTSILDIFAINGADNILHLLITAVALYFGFSGPKQVVAQPMQ